MFRQRKALYSFGLVMACGIWGCQSTTFVADGAPVEAQTDVHTDEPGHEPVGHDNIAWPDDSPMALLPFYSTHRDVEENDDMHWLLQSDKGTNLWGGIANGTIDWIRQPGSTSNDSVYSVAAGSDGFVYVVGQTQGTTPDMVDSGGDMSGVPYGVSSSTDVFVKQYTTAGALVWTRRLGSEAGINDYATSITYSAKDGGAIYVTGYTNGLIPAGVQGRTGARNAQKDVFLAKFKTNGVLQWTSMFGSSLDDVAWGVATEQISGHNKSDGDVYVVGSAKSALPTAAMMGGDDAFVARFDSNGNRFWIKQFGTGSADIARGVAIDSDANVYVAGDTAGTLSGRTGGTPGGNSDIFLAKYTDTGSVINLEQRGSSSVDYATGVAVSRKLGTATEVYVAGYTLGSWFGTNGEPFKYDGFIFHYQNNQAVNPNGFATTPDLGALTWGNQSSLPGHDMTGGITADGLGNAYVAATFGTGMASYSSVLKFSPAGVDTFRVNLDSPTMDNARAVAVDYDNGVYLVGDTTGAYNLGSPDTTTTNKGMSDGVVLRSGIGCTIDAPNDGNCSVGWGWGDPHLRTFDGRSYDFQAGGEFVLVESTGGSPLTIQVRQQAIEWNQRVAIYKAFATMLGNDRVALYVDGSAALRINGQPTTLQPGMVRPTAGGGSILRRMDGSYVLGWPSGERAVIWLWPGGSLSIGALLAPLSRQNQVRGLFGNFDGNQDNEFALRNGTMLGSPLSYAQMYTDPNNYANSWRISSGESLFDYEPGQTTSTWNSVPTGNVNLADIPIADRIAAEEICIAAGVTDPTLLHHCMIDVALTNDAASATAAVQTQNVMNAQGLPPQPLSEVSVYSNDMQSAVGAEWSSASMCISPLGDRQMLGEFGNELVTLSLPAVPPHQMVTVTFDLIVMNGWDGEGPMGPSTFGFFDEAEGSLLLTTFSNTTSSQSYPGPYPSNNAPMSGSAENNTMYYPFGDSVYHLGFSYPHSDSDLMLHFYAQGLSGLMGEAWAIDNVNVVVGPANP